MSSYQTNIFKHVLTILEVDKEVQHILISKGLGSVRKVIHNKYETYQSLVDKVWSKISVTYMDQSVPFWKNYQSICNKSFNFNETDIIDNSTMM